MKKTIFLEEYKMNTRKWLFGCSLVALLYADNTIAGDPLNLKSGEISKQNFVEVNSTLEEEIFHSEGDGLSDAEWFSDAEDDAFFSDSEPSKAPLTQEQRLHYEEILKKRGFLEEREHLPSNMKENEILDMIQDANNAKAQASTSNQNVKESEILDMIQDANNAKAQASTSNQKKKKHKGKETIINESYSYIVNGAYNTIAGDPLNLKSGEISKQNFVEVNSTLEEETFHSEDDGLSDAEWFSDAEDDAFFSDSEPSKAPLTQEQRLHYEEILKKRGFLEEREHLPSNMKENEILDMIQDANNAKAQASTSNQKKKKHKGKETIINESYSYIVNEAYIQEDSDSDSNEAMIINRRTGKARSYYGSDSSSTGTDSDSSSSSSLSLYQTKFDPSKALESQKAHKDLFKYIKYKNIEEIKKILILKDALNKWNDKGQPALVMYARAGNLKMVKWLIENFKEHLDINAKDFKGDTALLDAAFKGHYDIVKYLVENADPNIADDQENTPLMIAVKKGYTEILKLLLALPNHLSADKILPLLNTYKNKQALDKRQMTASYKQMMWVDVNAKNNDEDTALLLAFNNKNLEIVNLLLEHGAKIDSGNRIFSNMLEWAVKSKENASFDTVKRLLRFRKNFDDKNFGDPKFGRELLKCAIRERNFDKAWLLIEKGADINGLKKEFANNELYKDLLGIYSAVKNKTNVNIENENGDTPLLRVVRYKPIQKVKFDLMKRLLESGANVNAVDADGWTPLFYVKGVKTAQLLIDHGANVYWRSENDGHTWLTSYTMVCNGLPTEKDKLPMIEFILKQLSEEKINESTNAGNTALHIASRYNYAEIAELLVNHGADIHLRNGKGETPLMRAAQFDSTKVARVLLNTDDNIAKLLDIEEISQDELNEALLMAAKFGSANFVELLLDTRDIPQNQIDKALEIAKKKRDEADWADRSKFDGVIKILNGGNSESYNSSSDLSDSDDDSNEPYIRLNFESDNSSDFDSDSESSSSSSNSSDDIVNEPYIISKDLSDNSSDSDSDVIIVNEPYIISKDSSDNSSDSDRD